MKKNPVAELKIADIMTTSVVVATFDMSIKALMELLIKQKVSGVPIVDLSSRKLISLVTEADLIRFAAMKDIHAALSDFSDKLPKQDEISVVHPEDPFSSVYEKFLKTPFRRIPIVDENWTIRGIVSRRDVMKAFLIVKKRKT